MKVTLVKSPIGTPDGIRRTLRALRLYKIHQTVDVVDNPQVKGMVQKVAHLLEIHK